MTVNEAELNEGGVLDGDADLPDGQSRTLEELSTAVSAVLAAVGIGHVVVVDEDFEVSLADVISALDSDIDKVGPLQHLGDIDLSDERENWEADVTERWRQLSDAEKAEASQAVQAETGADFEAPEDL